MHFFSRYPDIASRHTREGGYPYGVSTTKTLWTPAFARVTALLLTLLLSVSVTAQEDELKLTPITPETTIFGDLRYLWGFELESDDPKFGGFSGLTGLRSVKQGANTHHLLGSVTDTGYYASWEIIFPSNGAPSISLYPLQPITKEAGTATDKIKFDVEAITEFEEWNLYGYEQDHRVVNINPEATRISRPHNLDLIPPDGGFEAMTMLKNNVLLIVAEHPDRNTKQQLAWLGRKQAGGDFRYEARTVILPEGYYPSDATTLMNGDVVLLLRKFSLFKGFSTKLLRITHEAIMSGDPLEGHEIADFPFRVNFDNLEGIASMPHPAGGEAIYLISDDNFSTLQKTVFLAFQLQY